MKKLYFSAKIRIIILTSLTAMLAVYAAASFAVIHKLRIDATFFSLEQTARSFEKVFAENDSLTAKKITESIAAQKILRLTQIDSEGHVLLESEQYNSERENHANRPEVITALHGTIGREIRYSNTLKEYAAYLAIPINDGRSPKTVLRLSLPIPEIKKQVRYLVVLLASIGIVLVCFSILFSKYIASKVSKPIYSLIHTAKKWAQGNFDERIPEFFEPDFNMLSITMNQMAEKMGETLTSLIKLEAMRRDFVANVSHELRTPITLIKGFSENLLDDRYFKLPAPPVSNKESKEAALPDSKKEPAEKQNTDIKEMRNMLEIINKNADRMESIITDLLMLAKIENASASVREDFIPTDTAFLVQSIADKFKLQAAKKEIIIQTNTQEGLYAFASTGLIEMALSNLVDNAIKYSPAGAVVSIKTESKKKAVRFTVQNSGSTISEKDLPRIFERFYRADKARSRELGGTGLGLAIVKHIALIHGGRCSCISENGNTCFHLDISLCTDENEFNSFE
ncbi:sensor histidine kinase [Treponema phagedenis]|uniref:histidine kinase n=1 Tax=Treponema phagedenis TaxID=162 RepID=A0A0B7GQK7_TREPH|nr:ATP-binding protein [Treponema phagedenis]NVP22860.1 GHKL domain-containing protein [Treponema phagedenis]QEJ94935.1 GHKL domain-containing protein [Treponema phagedenis]QEJ98337.1 GHKL domain-containing protein [Treponema phagedenis]QEK00836.1 GHKL domain-containing protein [Treponema phagedenis]QEK03847.1 GHKL domain-containing protein [Treponema phagedenis]